MCVHAAAHVSQRSACSGHHRLFEFTLLSPVAERTTGHVPHLMSVVSITNLPTSISLVFSCILVLGPKVGCHVKIQDGYLCLHVNHHNHLRL